MHTNLAFTWEQELSVGDEAIDREHQQIFQMTNTLLEEVLNDTFNAHIILNTLRQLDEYIITHFTHEENYMREHAYPETDQHQAIHAAFSKEYAELREKIVASNFQREEVLELEAFVGNWLTTHVMHEDQKYHRYIQEHPAQA